MSYDVSDIGYVDLDDPGLKLALERRFARPGGARDDVLAPQRQKEILEFPDDPNP